MLQRFLVAIDGSESGNVALDFATAVARQASGSIRVLLVNEQLIGSRNLLLFTRDEATALITDAVERLREAGIQGSGSVRPAAHRHVAAMISAEAQRYGADAIVLGSRRRRRLGRFFSSQVRERTTRATSLPVLTAPSPLEIGTIMRRRDSEVDLSREFDLEEFLRISR